jgi:serine/threonine protein kinase
MWSGIGYMHHHGFVHRDVKPANYLFADGSDDARLKLIDMGFATPYEQGIPLTARVGTVECSAPEVIQGSYDAKCDIWSIGIVLYYCCVSYCPFNGPSAEEILRKILREDVQFPPQDWKVVGPMTRKIIFEMLTKDVAARPSAQQLSARYAGVLAPVVEELSSMFESSPAQAPLNYKQADYGSYRKPSQESLQTGSSAETTASSAKEFTRAPSKESLSSQNSSKEFSWIRSSWSKRRLSWPHKLIRNQVRRVSRLSARISTRSL